jgi:prepilin-type N-terminal cleavage/methylation domain-containing protein
MFRRPCNRKAKQMRIAANRSAGFTMVELMIVAAVIGMLAAIAIPSLVRARTESQVNACINNLRQIDDASQEWALDTHQAPTATVAFTDIQPYLKSSVTCPSAGDSGTFASSYTLSTVSNKPVCKYFPATHVLAADGGGSPRHVQPVP